jgi:hypothetical protein
MMSTTFDPLWRITFIAIEGCPNERTNPRRFS